VVLKKIAVGRGGGTPKNEVSLLTKRERNVVELLEGNSLLAKKRPNSPTEDAQKPHAGTAKPSLFR